MKIKYLKPILMYHCIDDAFRETKLSVSPKSFRQHLSYLKKSGKETTSLSGAQTTLENKKNQVTITFDDGFQSCYEYAFPLLKEFSQTAVFFIITDFIGKPGYMNPLQIQELQKEGFAIGSHTKSHRWLPDLTPEELKDELTTSRKILEDLTGTSVREFCYPMGGFNVEVIEAVKRAGYESACATNPPKGFAWNDPFTLKRIKMSRTSDNPLNLWLKVSGYYSYLFG